MAPAAMTGVPTPRTRSRTTHGHLGDVYAVIAKNGSHGADDAGPIAVREYQQVSIEIRFQPEFIQSNQPRHAVAKEGATGDNLFLLRAGDFHRHRRAERAGLDARFLAQLNTAFLQQKLSVDDVHILGEGFL